MINQNKSKVSSSEALAKIYRYCAYQERCHQEVRNKLYGYGLYSSEVDELISRLITEGFLNEERFAKAFAGGKFRIKKWGRLKIQHELESLGLTKNCIRRGMQEIDAADYTKALYDLVKKKSRQTMEESLYKKRDKVARFVITKGYEPELVWQVTKEILPG